MTHFPHLSLHSVFGPGTGPKIAIVVGEPSGDLLGSVLIEALKMHYPNARFSGVAGPRIRSMGVHSIGSMEVLSVCGIIEVIRHLPSLLTLRRKIIKAYLNERPDLYIGIDAPDFNLGIERQLKKRGIPTVHYVSPSIWAWRPGRIHKIRAAVTHILLLFPFELAIYQKANIAATYVGHPLADTFPLHPNAVAVRDMLAISPHRKPILAFLPGSRVKEVAALAPLFIETARQLYERYPDLLILVPFVSSQTRQLFEHEIWKQNAQALPWRLMFGHAHEAMLAADVILLASGTATLEAMFAKRPMVVVYRVAPMTYFWVKCQFLLPYVSLPNIISGRFLVPEFLQSAANVANLVQVISSYVEDKRLCKLLSVEFTRQHELLRCDTVTRAAEVIVHLLGKKP